MNTATPTPTASERIANAVRVLLAARNEHYETLIDVLGCKRTAAFLKVSGKTRWTADEVVCVANYFDVPVAALYDGPDALLNAYSVCLTTDDILGANPYRDAVFSDAA